MAKELPYFKFEPNQWDNGNVQICSREAKGLFIDICSMYWSRCGELPEKLAIMKLCNGNANALQELCKEQILQVIDGEIVIKFLDDQLSEFIDVSEKRRNAANERWKNANAKQVHSKRNAIREEKRRKEERREEKIENPFSDSFLSVWDQWKAYKKSQFNFKYKTTSTEQAAITELLKVSGGAESVAIEIINRSIANGWKGFFKLENNGRQSGLDNVLEAAHLMGQKLH